MEQSPSRSGKRFKIAIAIILILVHIGLIVLFFVKLDDIIIAFNAITDWIYERPVGGMILLMVCFIFGITIMIPTTLFIFTIGMQCHNLMGGILGYFIGLLMVYFCTLCGSTLAFILSRYLLKESLLNSIKPSMVKTRAILKALETKGFRLVLLFRLAPIFPFSLLNYALGASSVSLKDYVLGSIGLIPKQALYMYVAVSVGSLSEAIEKEESNTTQLIVILSVGAVLAIVAAGYLTYLAKKEMKKMLEESQPFTGFHDEPASSLEISENR